VSPNVWLTLVAQITACIGRARRLVKIITGVEALRGRRCWTAVKQMVMSDAIRKQPVRPRCSSAIYVEIFPAALCPPLSIET
jgi:hypothetical protein